MIKSFKIITIFPELFAPLLKTKVFERAAKSTKIELHDLREYARDKRRTVDDTPYGGGCGMVLKPEPIARALESIKRKRKVSRRIICLTPQGRLFDQRYAKEILDTDEVVLLCGRYEGIDQRVIDMYVDEELSIGDFILSGGEIAAMTVMETVVRMIPGVLGNEESFRKDSFSDGLLKYPQYTRPEDFKGVKVPGILLSGDHEKIRNWRREQSIKRTKERRPDLYRAALREDR